MTHEIAGVSTCKLCGERFTGPAAVIVGNPHGRLMSYMEALAAHIAQQHPKHNRALDVIALEYLGMLKMLCFTTADEALRTQVDFLRWRIHQSTLNCRLTDDILILKAEDTARELAAGMLTGESSEALRRTVLPCITANLTRLLTEMRAIFEEPGRYAVQMVAPPENGQIKPQ